MIRIIKKNSFKFFIQTCCIVTMGSVYTESSHGSDLIDLYDNLSSGINGGEKLGGTLLENFRNIQSELNFLKNPTKDEQKIATLGTNEEALNLAYVQSLESLRRNGENISKFLSENIPNSFPQEEFQFYDVVCIGAGVHEQIFINTISNNQKTLSVEKGNFPAMTFFNAGETVTANSSTRKVDPSVPNEPGVGSLNYFPNGIVQLSLLSGKVYQTLGTFGKISTINRSIKSKTNPVIFNWEVVNVKRTRRDFNLPKYQITIKNNKGNITYLYANNIVDARGVGNPKGLSSDNITPEQRRQLVFNPDKIIPATIQQQEIYKSGGKYPNVFHSSDIYEFVKRELALTGRPLTPFINKKIAVVGSGDSSKTIIEFLTRNPIVSEKAYGRDNNQAGAINKIFWVGQSDKNCKDYLANNRIRYASIAGSIKGEKVIAVPQKAREFVVKGDKVILSFGPGQADLEVDIVIYATGYTQSFDLYDSLFPNEGILNGLTDNKDSIELKRVTNKRLNKNVTVKKLKNESIFFVGPIGGDYFNDEENEKLLKGIYENKVSIFGLGPITEGTANLIGGSKAKTLLQ